MRRALREIAQSLAVISLAMALGFAVAACERTDPHEHGCTQVCRDLGGLLAVAEEPEGGITCVCREGLP